MNQHSATQETRERVASTTAEKKRFRTVFQTAAGNTFKYINTHRYLLLLLYIPIYFIWFFLIEHYITTDYWVSYIPLDDQIPFIPAFILLYILWYPYLLLPGLYLLWKDVPAYKRYMWFIIIGLSICLLICTVFPNGQDLRPDLSEQHGFFISLVRMIYSADTNTNVLPSMHVVGCVAVCYGAFTSPYLKSVRLPLLIVGILISASTVFVKQHSFLDVIYGVVVSSVILVCFLLARRIWSRTHEKQF
jgi:membrane-associated phospholipid phosphatase